jgi:hypothetical protein
MYDVFGLADCDTDHCLVVAEVGERLTGNKQAAQKSDVEGFNLWMLNELEVRKQYQIEISNRFAAMENLFNSIYFAFHRSNTRSPRTYGYGDSQIQIKNNLHKYKLYR